MKKSILFWIFWCICTFVYCQTTGSWHFYPALQICNKNVPTKDRIFALCEGNIFSYNLLDTEIQTYSKINGLNDIDIRFMNYNKDTDKLILVYENGNIDLLYDNGDVVNHSQIKDKNYASFTINNLCITGNIAFICTNFGFISFDIEKEIFTNTYDLQMAVFSGFFDDNNIYISTEKGCFIGNRNDNLLDKKNWKKTNDFVFQEMIENNKQIICLNSNEGLYEINKETLECTQLKKEPFIYLTRSDKKIIAGSENEIWIFDDKGLKKIKQKNDFNDLKYSGGQYWASRNKKGLQPYKLEEFFVASQSPIQPNSPIRNYFCEMHYAGNRLLVAGGDLNYNGVVREGTAMYYENGEWYNFSEDNITEQTRQKYINLTSIAQNPQDPTQHFIASSGQGLYEFKDLQFVKKYDYTNSTLQTILPNSSNKANYVRCDALQYDKNNNLWMFNNEVDTLIKIYKKDGTWTKLYYENISKSTANDNIHFDRNGNVWMTNRRLDKAGIFFLNYNGTLEDTSDDIYKHRNKITNQDGITYSPYEFYCLCEDLEGDIWIGTVIGPFVIEYPENFTSDNFTFKQVKINRNDGSNLADYLLNEISITAITIDAANRKWIGTASNGVYLVSADGQEMLQHFTTDNSPLVSNEILSIAVSPENGEVMIGTMKGLNSYMSDATTPKETLEKNNIRIYPNPVRPEYSGLISIDGLSFDSEVKITTVTGQLVYSGYSNGGLFTWNGCNFDGKRVSSGIYNVIATNKEEKKSIVARITFIH